MKTNKCEQCAKDFERECVRRFCCKTCWHKWNAKNLASFNDTRFQWKNCTEEEKLERIRSRFEEKVIKTEGCWGWNGHLDKNGYPLMKSGSDRKSFKEARCNRISWLLYRGEIPEGKYLCHQCDNPTCTNPDHLFLASAKENSQDMVKKARGNKGTKHGNAKLNDQDVVEIRQLLRQGKTGRFISEKFSIDPNVVSGIKHGKSWTHVQEGKITLADNLRMKCGTQGSSHRDAKLKEEDVKKIKYLLSIGVSAKRLAQDFGISSTQISYIKSGKNWKHVTI